MNQETVLKYTDICKVKKLADSNNVEVTFNFYQHTPVVIGRKQLVLILEQIVRDYSPDVYPGIHNRARDLAADCRRMLWPRTV